MNAKHRIYSLPYNGTNPEWYLQEAEKRKEHIDHVYCELPSEEMLSHVRFLFDGAHNTANRTREAAAQTQNAVSGNGATNPSQNTAVQTHDEANQTQNATGKAETNAALANADLKRAAYIQNCATFLRISKGRVRRICPVNAMYYQYETEEALKDFVISLAQAANYYQLEGFILSDYRMAVLLHALLPDLEIQTSCNAYPWNLKQMEMWRDKCGAKVFNPPREILRVPAKLKEMHAAGFKLKCLINEACLMGCPNSFNHNLSIAMRCNAPVLSCCQNGIADLFRANWILPRWQKHYDEYVAIYKIAGRNSEGDYPFKTMDAYLHENTDLPLTELMISGTVSFAHRMAPAEALRAVTLDKVPDKLLACECRECEQCHLCETILQSLVPEEYWERFRFKIKVTGR